jgi:hypothetical protein
MRRTANMRTGLWTLTWPATLTCQTKVLCSMLLLLHRGSVRPVHLAPRLCVRQDRYAKTCHLVAVGRPPAFVYKNRGCRRIRCCPRPPPPPLPSLRPPYTASPSPAINLAPLCIQVSIMVRAVGLGTRLSWGVLVVSAQARSSLLCGWLVVVNLCRGTCLCELSFACVGSYMTSW